MRGEGGLGLSCWRSLSKPEGERIRGCSRDCLRCVSNEVWESEIELWFEFEVSLLSRGIGEYGRVLEMREIGQGLSILLYQKSNLRTTVLAFKSYDLLVCVL